MASVRARGYPRPFGAGFRKARPIPAINATGAGDAFAGAFAYSQAMRWDLEPSLRFANAVASIVVTAVGAQTALPSRADALAAAGLDP